MCITQIWRYRECGCQYHKQVPCHPSFTCPPSTPFRQRAHIHFSNTSSSSDRSPISANGSTFSNSDPLPKLSRQCSVQHTVYKNFLEPICDDCLLEELGLQPELGPILGGRDLQEGFQGEEWILESSVEINVEDSGDDIAVSSGCDDDDDEDAADADDEGEFRGRSGRRSGMDISRDALRISSDLSVDGHESLALSREQLRGARPEGRETASTIVKAPNEGKERVSTAVKVPKDDRSLKPRWSQQLHNGLARKRKTDKRLTSFSRTDDSSTDSLKKTSLPSLLDDHVPGVRISSPKITAQLPSDSPPGIARDSSFDIEDEIISLYETNCGPDTGGETGCPSWSQHLQADLQERQTRRTVDLAAAAVPNEATTQEPPQSPSSIRSSPQTATPFTSPPSASPPDLQALNLSPSEFDRDDTATPPPQVPTLGHAHAHAHTPSIDSTISSTSTFCTAPSVPSSPASTRPTTATSITTTTPPTTQQQQHLSIHPLSTILTISTPHRPSLTPRTSSLHSPPASSPLLHSTPPLRQSPTNAFVCVHERCAFRGCGCDGPRWVRSCVCERACESGGDDVGDEDAAGCSGEEDGEARGDGHGHGHGPAKDGCRAVDPLVRTRWFFNRTCEACLGRDGGGDGGDGCNAVGKVQGGDDDDNDDDGGGGLLYRAMGYDSRQ